MKSIWQQRRRALRHARTGAWFIPYAGSYLPCSWRGYATYVPFVGLPAVTFILAWQATASIGLTLLFTVANGTAAGFVLTQLARSKS